MSWKLIDESWKAFAQQNGLELKVTDSNYLYGVKTTYHLILPDQKLEINSQIVKSTSGLNRYRTQVIKTIHLKSVIASLEVSDKRTLGFIKNNYKDRQKQVLLATLRAYRAKKIITTDDNVQVYFDFAFSTHSDFENGIKLTQEILMHIKPEKP